jgi:peptide/nickel transport system ATP-binding protein
MISSIHPPGRRAAPLLQGDESALGLRVPNPLPEARCASVDMRLREVQTGNRHACWRDDLLSKLRTP